jgi:hypothetical protein
MTDKKFCYGMCEALTTHYKEVRVQTLTVEGQTITLDIPMDICSICHCATPEPSYGDPVTKAIETARRIARPNG